jgi:tyrosine-protein phosphatase MSG5
MQPTDQRPFPRKRNAPSSLRIDAPAHASTIVLSSGDSPVASVHSSESECVLLCSPKKPRSLNMKKLSLNLPSARSSTHSLSIVVSDSQPTAISPIDSRRRPSVISLPVTSTATSLFRQDEGGSPSIPYADGPVEILPKIWLGSEDNARDWRGLVHRGIKSVLNVAKEVSCPFDSFAATKALRPTVSTSNLAEPLQDGKTVYYPAHVPSGRPGMHYLKLPWSHGQPDLVNIGLPAAFEYVDEALARGDGVLIQLVHSLIELRFFIS